MKETVLEGGAQFAQPVCRRGLLDQGENVQSQTQNKKGMPRAFILVLLLQNGSIAIQRTGEVVDDLQFVCL